MTRIDPDDLLKVADLSRHCVIELQEALTGFHDDNIEDGKQRIVGSAIMSALFNVTVMLCVGYGLSRNEMHDALAGCIAHNMGDGETRQ